PAEAAARGGGGPARAPAGGASRPSAGSMASLSELDSDALGYGLDFYQAAEYNPVAQTVRIRAVNAFLGRRSEEGERPAPSLPPSRVARPISRSFPDERALERLDRGPGFPLSLDRIAGINIAVNLCWLIVSGASCPSRSSARGQLMLMPSWILSKTHSVASAGFDGTVRIWDARAWTPELRLEHQER